MSDTPARTVRPRDAASLVIVDTSGAEPRVLMGRRHAKMKFIPDAFVFPGGKLDPDDMHALPATQLRDAAHFGSPAKARGLAMAAVRETFEETGLILARPGDVGALSGKGWEDFRRDGIAPNLAVMSGLARAITPRQSPIRFHARFFATTADNLSGTLKGSGELEDLDWYPISAALKLPVIDVTEFVLTEVRAIHADGVTRAGAPLYSYRNNKPVVRSQVNTR
ncbi:MAG: NUDIX hydrolase [Parvibaculum sp.]|nr:NUDIX hydrolase [Parvibaculum sp.]